MNALFKIDAMSKINPLSKLLAAAGAAALLATPLAASAQGFHHVGWRGSAHFGYAVRGPGWRGPGWRGPGWGWGWGPGVYGVYGYPGPIVYGGPPMPPPYYGPPPPAPVAYFEPAPRPYHPVRIVHRAVRHHVVHRTLACVPQTHHHA